MTDRFNHLFKPEVRNAASLLIKKNLVYLQIGSDTQIDASIRGTAPVKVALRTESIEATEIFADCTCKASAKGSLCKHIWAVLELASEKSPDFFEMKTDLQKATHFSASPGRRVSTSQSDFQQKQADYRKQSYQTRKQRVKDRKLDQAAVDRKQSIKSSAFSQSLPDEVKAALTYFEKNGFLMNVPVDESTVNNAKRILSRVFHPDKGGAHEEMLELLRHAKTLNEFRL